ncbi:hypothetical protein PEY33_001430 [Campylobacter coli]|uniref:hypothetical protein n=1 Tax=Campylobacter coli TaxID=195 RepID=UPI000FA49472|nr:hypothetical protein [Campylobacter coli]EAI0640758.1 hypothetical protein [Campylobacter coli]EAJ2047118.1 hypothetical protein [Campylobacter coli]EAK5688059.1 hypothetical protein [Campylobacter coli]EAL1666719.1 hypothetical protein [Campylobacter coli]
MLFGFDDKIEFIPRVYSSLCKQELVKTFLIQYNASIDSALRIPLSYAKSAKDLKMPFQNFLQDVIHTPFGKIKNIDKNLTLNISYFQKRKSLIFKTKIFQNVDILRLLRAYFRGICFDAQVLFDFYVYDKISHQNQNRSIIQNDNLIIIDNKIAVLPLCKEVDLQNLNIDNEIQEISKFIYQNQFEQIYIVCPRNKKFTHFIQIKHFLCDLNKTMLKLVPYSITNKLIRRK